MQCIPIFPLDSSQRLVKKSILLYLVILTLLLAAVFWGTRSLGWWSSSRSPLTVISTTSPLLIGWPAAAQVQSDQLWYLDFQEVHHLLDTLGFTSASWQNWWVIPGRGQGEREVAYTFVGQVGDWNGSWSSRQYGPTLPFNGGDIYTHAYGTEEALYFSRFDNLLVIGQFPFQLENAWRNIADNAENWANESLIANWQNALTKPLSHQHILLHTPSLSIDLPETWLQPESRQELEQTADWFWARIDDQSDSLAHMSVRMAKANNNWLAETLNWDWLPENTRQAVPLYAATPKDDALSAFSTSAWALKLDNRFGQQSPGSNLWVFPLQDTAGFTQQWRSWQEKWSVIDYEDYQAQRFVRVQRFPLLDRITDRRGNIQPWILKLPDALVVAIEREILERWLDYYTLNANLSQAVRFREYAGTLQQPGAFVSWGPLEDGQSTLLSLLFPNNAWAKHGFAYAAMQKQEGEEVELKITLAKDWRAANRLSLAWTQQMSSTLSTVVPVRGRNNNTTIGTWLQTSNAQITHIGEGGTLSRLPPIKGTLLGAVTQVKIREQVKYYFTTTEGVFSWDGQSISPVPSASLYRPTVAATLLHGGEGESVELLVAGDDGALHLQTNTPIGNEKSWVLDTIATSLRYAPLHRQTATTDTYFSWHQRLGWQAWNWEGQLLWQVAPDTTLLVSQPTLVGDGFLQAETTATLATVHANGQLQLVEIEGGSTAYQLGRGPIDHAVVLPSGKQPSVVAQRGKLLHQFSKTGASYQEDWQVRLPEMPDTLFKLSPLGTGAWHRRSQQLWLITEEGVLWPEFPVRGHTFAELLLTSQGHYQLLTYADGQVYAYDLGRVE